jgi:enoyl-CoA hydratase/carnithine racemase
MPSSRFRVNPTRRTRRNQESLVEGGELGEGIAREREVATELFATPDGQEGFAAFRERRVPAFAAGQLS